MRRRVARREGNGRRKTDRDLRVRRYRADMVHRILRPEGISWMAYP